MEQKRNVRYTGKPGYEKSNRAEPSRDNRKEVARRYSKPDDKPVAPRGTYIVAGRKLLQQVIQYDEKSNNAWIPHDWCEKISEARISLCRKATAELGYTLKLLEGQKVDSAGLSISVESSGFPENQDGNVHMYAVSEIYHVEDCLQLIADFSAIGLTPVTHYKNRHIALEDTGKLRLELETWNLPFMDPKNEIKKESFDEKIKSAASRTASSRSMQGKSRTEPER